MLTNPPNLLTVSRILLIPVLVGLFYVEGAWAQWLACAVFVIAVTLVPILLAYYLTRGTETTAGAGK